ncbi:MAG: methyltransferase domain-containing protein [Proteobacteria bacterium]|nr:methyltransferase domain-containing protein [Pseudomonadota bacterium]
MSTATTERDALYARALAKHWFYPLTLPDGRKLTSSHDGRVDAIHHTRARMLDAFLADRFADDRSALGAIDLACHQGWFSLQLARAGFGRVEAVDARREHVEDAALLADIYQSNAMRARQSDVFALKPDVDGTHDLVLMFGLLYHLENPIGALRVARALARRACVIETQVVPHMAGMVDWGSYEYVRPLKGCFGIIDEVDETHAPEASVTGVCLAPSTEGLLWLLRAIGFREAWVLPVPSDGYEQLRHGKRVMVAALV